jgi:GH15 family glucan-1,4-alpha-glucosidase
VPAISDYGFLSDCQSTALVGRDGSVDWYCVPRLDSPSVFGRILDEKAGHWSITPRGDYRDSRSYLADSLVLRTEFATPGGRVALTDALALSPESRGHEIGRRVPHELLRRVEGVSGAVEVDVEFTPRMEYGLTTPRFHAEDGRLRAAGGRVELVLETDASHTCDESGRGRYTVHAGERIDYRLRTVDAFGADLAYSSAEGVSSLEDTLNVWRSWADLHRDYKGLYLDPVKRSALVLQGLTFQPSGALAAAATTSLPERRSGGWNWDYRFGWIRDASLTMFAEWIASCPDEPVRFFHWIEQAGGILEEEAVQIVYGLTGERDLTEHSVDRLAGFDGVGPVIVGNDAWRQRQLDVLGNVLDAAHLLRNEIGELDEDTKDLLAGYADRAATDWRLPDAGMWEARDGEQHYTSSKVMCWVALDRAVKMADRLAPHGHVERWTRERDAVRQTVLDEAWSASAGAYAGAFGSDELDASVLMMPIVGFLPASDPRMLATTEAVRDRLGVRGFVRRWEGEPNGFLICSYWLVECLVMAGRTDEAASVFERVTTFANDLGLLAEEVDVETGELLGNFPQAFSHVGLVNAAWRLTQAREESGKARAVAERP